MAVTYVQYEADGWGVGELVLEGSRVLHSELPRAISRSGADGAAASAPGPAPSSLRRRAERADGQQHPLAERLRAWFAGEPDDFADVEVELQDETPFGRRLAEELRRVPRGEVVTYGELALLAGRARAARAAGSFCARCALAPILPVHRVVSVGGLGGFGSLGPDYKRRLLALEGLTFPLPRLAP